MDVIMEHMIIVQHLQFFHAIKHDLSCGETRPFTLQHITIQSPKTTYSRLQKPQKATNFQAKPLKKHGIFMR